MKQDKFGHSNVDFNSKTLMLKHVVHLSKCKEKIDSESVTVPRLSNS